MCNLNITTQMKITTNMQNHWHLQVAHIEKTETARVTKYYIKGT